MADRTGASFTATRWLAGRYLRARWAALLSLALIVLMGATGALVAAGAADRTAGAYDAYLARAGAGDVVINPSLLTAEIDKVIRALPGVRSVTRDDLFLAGIHDGIPFLRADLDRGDQGVQVRGSTDGRYATMDRPAIATGRLPVGPGEAIVSVELAHARSVGVGDVLPLTFFSVIDELLAPPDAVMEPAGVERVKVVGTATFSDEVLPDGLYPRQRIVVSRDVAERYGCLPPTPPSGATLEEAATLLTPRGCATSYAYYSLEVAGGAGGVAAALDAYTRESTKMNEALPEALLHDDVRYYLIATTTAEERGRVQDATRPGVAALNVLAAAAAFVTMVVLGLAVARELRRTEDDQVVWRRLGLSKVEGFGAVVLPLAVVVAAGLAAAAGLAWLLSPVGPVGIVRSVEPSPGRDVSAWVGLGGLALGAACMATAAALAWSAARRAGPVDKGAGNAPPVPRLLTASPWTELNEGARAAYASRGARLVAASTGVAVAVLVAAVVFRASLSATLSTPASYGWPWDVAMMGGFGYGGLDLDKVDASLAGRDDVERWTGLGFFQGVTLDGATEVAVVGLEARPGVDFSVVEGRLPQTVGEVALGSRTAAGRGLGVGDTVELAGDPIEPRTATVTGLAVLPPLGPYLSDRTGPGTGMVLPSAAFDPAVLAGTIAFVGIDLAPNADPAAVLAELHDDFVSWDVNGFLPFEYQGPVRPPEIADARSMQAVPLLIGGLLAGAAVVGLTVAVVLSVRSRRRQLAILQAIGFTGRQVRTSVRAQVLATMAVALMAGVPLGVAAGRIAWRAFAGELGVVINPTTPALWVGAVAVALSVMAALAGAVPARLANRISPAAGLRTE